MTERQQRVASELMAFRSDEIGNRLEAYRA
jgi:hypothetical protein